MWCLYFSYEFGLNSSMRFQYCTKSWTLPRCNRTKNLHFSVDAVDHYTKDPEVGVLFKSITIATRTCLKRIYCDGARHCAVAILADYRTSGRSRGR